jgi:hypothetical protein
MSGSISQIQAKRAHRLIQQDTELAEHPVDILKIFSRHGTILNFEDVIRTRESRLIEFLGSPEDSAREREIY